MLELIEDTGAKTFKYLYDFGDGWEHTVKIERVGDPAPGIAYPRLIDAQGRRAWKGFDWDALDRLHKKGFISDPVSKAKSVTFTEDGLREAERLFRELFATRG